MVVIGILIGTGHIGLLFFILFNLLGGGRGGGGFGGGGEAAVKAAAGLAGLAEGVPAAAVRTSEKIGKVMREQESRTDFGVDTLIRKGWEYEGFVGCAGRAGVDCGGGNLFAGGSYVSAKNQMVQKNEDVDAGVCAGRRGAAAAAGPDSEPGGDGEGLRWSRSRRC